MRLNHSIWAGRGVTTASAWMFLFLATGCQSSPRVSGPIRAIWVTRFDYKTSADVTRIMDNCRDAGFNTVLFQVRGNGTVSYPSRIEPWGERFDFKDPGFDPLEQAIRESHARGMKLHAWVNVMPAWRGPGEPTERTQLYHAHPDWFWYDREGVRQPIRHKVGNRVRDWYVSLNPCLPEVRQYLVGVFEELVRQYRVDGLHMDYIRFPNERVVPGEKIPDYPRDARTLALFTESTGHTPESSKEAWNQWRTEQVTRLVADVHAMMRRTRSGAVLSAAVSSRRAGALTHFQDADAWMEAGIVDAVVLMNYAADVELFEKRLTRWLGVQSETRVIPGLTIRAPRDEPEDPATARRQIEIARAATDGFCFFAYSKLFDSPNVEFDRQEEDARKLRNVRRELLMPFLQSLPAADKAG